MASTCSILSELKHIVLNIPAEFNNAQDSYRCIYKVPVNLRKVNSVAYTPQLIAIGSIHHKNKKLKPMEREKKRYYQFFWSRYQPNAQKLLEDYISKLEHEEQNIRDSYSVTFPEYSKKEFVEIILFDAVFIMELFLRFSDDKNLLENDYMITKPWLQKSIFRDLILLENQIPMFVLMELYDAVVAKEKRALSSFLHLAINCFKYREIYNPEEERSQKENKHEDSLKLNHLTDLIRYFHLPDKLLDVKFVKLDMCSVLKTATQLNEAGVTFQKKVEHKECLLDIEFKKMPFWSYFLCLSCSPICFNCFKARFRITQLRSTTPQSVFYGT